MEISHLASYSHMCVRSLLTLRLIRTHKKMSHCYSFTLKAFKWETQSGFYCKAVTGNNTCLSRRWVFIVYLLKKKQKKTVISCMLTAGQQGDRLHCSLQLCGKMTHTSSHLTSNLKVQSSTTAHWLFVVAHRLGSEVPTVTTLFFRNQMEIVFF